MGEEASAAAAARVRGALLLLGRGATPRAAGVVKLGEHDGIAAPQRCYYPADPGRATRAAGVMRRGGAGRCSSACAP